MDVMLPSLRSGLFGISVSLYQAGNDGGEYISYFTTTNTIFSFNDSIMFAA